MTAPLPTTYRDPATGEAVVPVVAQPAPRVLPGRRIAECFAACVVAVLLMIALEVLAPVLWALVMGPVS